MRCQQVPWRTSSPRDQKGVAGEVTALGNGNLRIETGEADFPRAGSFFPLSFQRGEMMDLHLGLHRESSPQICQPP